MLGTIRTFDMTMQKDIHERIRRTAESIAQSAGAKAEVTIEMLPATPWRRRLEWVSSCRSSGVSRRSPYSSAAAAPSVDVPIPGP